MTRPQIAIRSAGAADAPDFPLAFRWIPSALTPLIGKFSVGRPLSKIAIRSAGAADAPDFPLAFRWFPLARLLIGKVFRRTLPQQNSYSLRRRRRCS